MPPRQRRRIAPPRAITVGIDDEDRLPLGYGIVPNVSETGACVWTDSRIESGARLVLRVSFADPAEVHEVAARVVWTGEEADPSGALLRRYGLQWQDFSSAYVLRLRRLVREVSGEEGTGSHPAVTPYTELDPPRFE